MATIQNCASRFQNCLWTAIFIVIRAPATRLYFFSHGVRDVRRLTQAGLSSSGVIIIKITIIIYNNNDERKQSWKEKMLHGQFLRQTDEEAGKESWLWLRSTGIKRETESLIMAAQEQAIRTNVIKAKIDKTQEESKCRMCGRVDETVNHVLSECSKMAQTEYKRRHDWVGNRIHWNVGRKYGIKL